MYKFTVLAAEHAYAIAARETPDGAIQLRLPDTRRPDELQGLITLRAADGCISTLHTGGMTFLVDNALPTTDSVASGSLLTITDKASNRSINLFVEYQAEALTHHHDATGLTGPIVIGSLPENAIRLNHPMISRRHVVLTPGPGGVIQFEDTSRNGLVYLNHRRMTRGELRAGDVLRVMGLTLFYTGEIFALGGPMHSFSCSLPGYMPAPAPSVKRMTETRSVTFARSARLRAHREEHTVKVDAPPAPQNRKQLPLIYTVGPSLTMGAGMLINMGSLLGRAMSGNADMGSVMGSMGMSAMMLASGILWPMLNKRMNDKRLAEDETYRVQRYSSYIKEKEALCEDYARRNRAAALSEHPAPDELARRALQTDRTLWERSPGDEDFLHVRFGLGKAPVGVTVEPPPQSFMLEEDALRMEGQRLKEAYDRQDGMPLCLPLADGSACGLMGHQSDVLDTLRCLLTQLVTLHASSELKLVFFLPPEWEQPLRLVKLLPHTWNDEHSLRYVASTPQEVQTVCGHLHQVMAQRASREGKGQRIPHYLVILPQQSMLQGQPLLRALLDGSIPGMSPLFLGGDLEDMPGCCRWILRCSDHQVYRCEDGQGYLHAYRADAFSESDFGRMASALAPVRPAEAGSRVEAVPESLSFLDMYRAASYDSLHVAERWQQSRTYKHIEAPIGAMAGGELFSLDLHEKHHGPHGLIAGMTGSGKSEFIQTMILSLAINYSPELVSFILIDFKGGGMADCFKGLPHLAGTITNLAGNAMQRSLMAINAELKRRQLLFSQHQVNHIDAYHRLWEKGKAQEAMPHLFIISDEFAQLKIEQPDFMNDLVSAARIGRSLGVHLILATQKPSGVVNDQIWSNANFHVCLKVLDKADSTEMLHRPEAASITLPGRCYVQVGYNEVFEYVQSAYSGAQYVPAPAYIDPQSEQVTLIDNAAQPLRIVSALPAAPKDAPTQLQAIVRGLKATGAQQRLTPYLLWQPPLPSSLALDELDSFRSAGTFNGTAWPDRSPDQWMKAVLGRCDAPSQQAQFDLVHDFASDGHLAIYGAAGAGATTLLLTLITSLARTHTPQECQFTVFDFAGRVLSPVRSLPHCHGVCQLDDSESYTRCLHALVTELERRKKLFSEHDVSSIQGFRQTCPEQPLPAQVLVIDNFMAMYERDGLDGASPLLQLLNQGQAHGIYVVMTFSSALHIPSRVTDAIPVSLALTLNNHDDYRYVLGVPVSLYPERMQGRGLCVHGKQALEFQAALPLNIADDAERTRKLREMYQQMSVCSKPVDPLPERRAASAAPADPAPQAAQPESAAPEMPETVPAGQESTVLPWPAPPAVIPAPGTPLGYDDAGRPVALQARALTTLSLWADSAAHQTHMLRFLNSIGDMQGIELVVLDDPRQPLTLPAFACPCRHARTPAEIRGEIAALFKRAQEERLPLYELLTGQQRLMGDALVAAMQERQPRILVVMPAPHAIFPLLGQEADMQLSHLVKNLRKYHLGFVTALNDTVIQKHFMQFCTKKELYTKGYALCAMPLHRMTLSPILPLAEKARCKPQLSAQQYMLAFISKDPAGMLLTSGGKEA